MPSATMPMASTGSTLVTVAAIGASSAAEVSEQRADEAARRGRERRDAQRRGSSHVARREPLESFEAREQLAALARKGPAVVGEQHAAPASLEQHRVEVAFELLHLLRDGRRGVAEPVGGGHD